MDRLRVGVIGCGRIASEFEDLSDVRPASIAGAFDALDETELVAAASRGRERLDRFGKRWGVERESLYGDYREMLRCEQLDLVAVATHPPLHADIVEAACDAGVRGIFCEKPMALDLVDCDRIVARTEAAGVKVVVNCSRRYNGDFESARRLIESGEFGDLVHIVGHCQGVKPVPEWQAETEGPLLHDAVHLLDIMRFLAGDVDSLVGTASNRTGRFAVEDTSHAILQFAGGAEGILIVDEMADYCDFSVELNFTRGRLRFGSSSPGAWKSVPDVPNENGWWQHLEPCVPPEPAWSRPDILGSVGNLVQAVLRDEEIRCDAHDGRASVELIMAIYESALAGGSRIYLPLTAGRSPLQALRDSGRIWAAGDDRATSVQGNTRKEAY